MSGDGILNFEVIGVKVKMSTKANRLNFTGLRMSLAGFIREHEKAAIAAVLLLGVLYRLAVTSGGNFIFNMDNARDMVDVREMVLLHKLRLIGPTSGIAGIYDGPLWYYLLSVPFIVSSGDPYSEIILMILLWLTGGIFLLKLAARFGPLAFLISAALWLSSNYVLLATSYAYNPNPVLLLTPLFVFVLSGYFKDGGLIYSIISWLLAGLFFNVEMAYGLFVPLVILVSLLVGRKATLILTKNFWAGLGVFLLTLMPQAFFYLRHRLLLTSTLAAFAHSGSGSQLISPDKTSGLISLYHGVLSATLMNQPWLVVLWGAGVLYLAGRMLIRRLADKDQILLICTGLILIPFLGAVVLPLNFMPWHLGGAMAAAILIFGITVSRFELLGRWGYLGGLLTTLVVLAYAVFNLEIPSHFNQSPSRSFDVSEYVNEVSAVDSTYTKAQGRNFKAYAYLPSVIDYPYQYLYWWRGESRYGYTPLDYAYLPDQPQYIDQKSKFVKPSGSGNSQLVFLVMEPDRDHPDRLYAWEDHFKHLQLVEVYQAGPINIQVRAEK